MSDWKSALKADPTDWLLEKDNPSIRYWTSTELLNKSESGSEVAEAKGNISESEEESSYGTLFIRSIGRRQNFSSFE